MDYSEDERSESYRSMAYVPSGDSSYCKPYKSKQFYQGAKQFMDTTRNNDILNAIHYCKKAMSNLSAVLYNAASDPPSEPTKCVKCACTISKNEKFQKLSSSTCERRCHCPYKRKKKVCSRTRICPDVCRLIEMIDESSSTTQISYEQDNSIIQTDSLEMRDRNHVDETSESDQRGVCKCHLSRARIKTILKNSTCSHSTLSGGYSTYFKEHTPSLCKELKFQDKPHAPDKRKDVSINLQVTVSKERKHEAICNKIAKRKSKGKKKIREKKRKRCKCDISSTIVNCDKRPEKNSTMPGMIKNIISIEAKSKHRNEFETNSASQTPRIVETRCACEPPHTTELKMCGCEPSQTTEIKRACRPSKIIESRYTYEPSKTPEWKCAYKPKIIETRCACHPTETTEIDYERSKAPEMKCACKSKIIETRCACHPAETTEIYCACEPPETSEIKYSYKPPKITRYAYEPPKTTGIKYCYKPSKIIQTRCACEPSETTEMKHVCKLPKTIETRGAFYLPETEMDCACQPSEITELKCTNKPPKIIATKCPWKPPKTTEKKRACKLPTTVETRCACYLPETAKIVCTCVSPETTAFACQLEKLTERICACRREHHHHHHHHHHKHHKREKRFSSKNPLNERHHTCYMEALPGEPPVDYTESCYKSARSKSKGASINGNENIRRISQDQDRSDDPPVDCTESCCKSAGSKSNGASINGNENIRRMSQDQDRSDDPPVDCTKSCYKCAGSKSKGANINGNENIRRMSQDQDKSDEPPVEYTESYYKNARSKSKGTNINGNGNIPRMSQDQDRPVMYAVERGGRRSSAGSRKHDDLNKIFVCMERMPRNIFYIAPDEKSVNYLFVHTFNSPLCLMQIKMKKSNNIMKLYYTAIFSPDNSCSEYIYKRNMRQRLMPNLECLKKNNFNDKFSQVTDVFGHKDNINDVVSVFEKLEECRNQQMSLERQNKMNYNFYPKQESMKVVDIYGRTLKQQIVDGLRDGFALALLSYDLKGML